MKWEKYKYTVTSLSVNFLMLLVFWGGMLRKSFNADTITHMSVNDADILINIEAGRYVISFCDFVLLKMGVRTTTNLSVTMLITFILFAIAMTELGRMFSKWKPDSMWEAIGFYGSIHLVFLNVLFAELLMFSEYCVYFGMAYLAAIVAAHCFVKRRYLLSVLSMGIAVFTYQYSVILAAVIIVFYVALDGNIRFSWDIVKRVIVGIFFCMFFGGLNLLSVKVLERLEIIDEFGKKAGWGDWKIKISDAIQHFILLNKNGGGILVNLWMPLLFILGVSVLIVYSCIKTDHIANLPFIFVIWLGSNLLLYVIPFMEETFYFPPRMSFCFFLVQGLMAVIAYVVGIKEVRGLLTLGCVMYLVVHLLFADFVVTNHFVSNTLDEVYVKMMYQEILKYEEETGIKVEKLAIAKDIDAPFNYAEVSFVADQINERTLGTSNTPLVWVMTGRRLERVDMDEDVYERYFKDKNWDYLDLSQQLIIDGNTAYWCIF